MYTLQISFSSAQELADFVSKMPTITMTAINPAASANGKTTSEPKKEAAPVVNDESVLEARKIALRTKLTEVNKKGDAYMKKNRDLLNSFDGARSITTLDAKHYDAFEKALDEIAKS